MSDKFFQSVAVLALMTNQLKTASGVISALPSAIKAVEPTIRDAITQARAENVPGVDNVEALYNAALALRIDQSIIDSLALFVETSKTLSPTVAKIITRG